jgi:hypothetical protein
MTSVEGCSNPSCQFAGDYDDDRPWSVIMLQRRAHEMSLARKIFSTYNSHTYARIAPKISWPASSFFKSMAPTNPREFDLVLSALVYAEDEVAVRELRKLVGMGTTVMHTEPFNVPVLTAMAEHLINDLGALPGALIVSSVGSDILQDKRSEFSYVAPKDPEEIENGYLGTMFDGYAGRIPVYSDFYRAPGTQALDADEIYMVGRPADMGYFVETTPLFQHRDSVTTDFFVVCKHAFVKAVRV